MGSKRKSRPRSTPAAAPSRKWRLRTESCEIAHEHDELFRGSADPAFLLLVVSAGEAGAARLLGRSLVHAKPSTVPGVALLVSATELHGATRAARVLILALGLEVDGGVDVARLYASAEDVGRFRVWLEEDIPAPITLEEIARSLAPGVATRVGVLLDDREVGSGCSDDQLLGAVAVAVPTTRGEHSSRLRFVSSDGKNDWTLCVGLELR